MPNKKIFLLLVNILGLSTLCAAQWEVGGNLGGAGYIGDLNQDKVFNLKGANFGGFVRANLNGYWSLGLHFNYGKIKGSDSESDHLQLRNRNLSFQTSLFETALLADFNFFDYFGGGGNRRFSPYLQVGVGAVAFSPKTRYLGESYFLRAYKTEGQEKPYAQIAPVAIYGAGVKYNVKDNWTVLANLSYRTAFTDYLDDVSGSYAGPSTFDIASDYQRRGYNLSDRSLEIGQPLNKPGTQRGDFRKRDSYLFVGIGISYTFVSQKCF